MNIYWITKINKKKFYGTSRIEVSNALRESGHNVKLVIERNIGEKPSYNNNFLFIPTVTARIVSRFLFGLIVLLYFPFIIRKEKIDVILIDGATIWSPFILSLKFLKIPLILDVRTLSTDKEKSLETIFYDTSLILSKYIFDGMTTITPELQDILVKKYKIKKEMIGIWTSGASKELISKPIEKNRNNQFSINSESIYLMYHGTLSITRGIETLIEAMAELKTPLKKKIKLIIVGIDKFKQKDLFELINKLDLHENIILIPPVDYNDICSYIDLCNVGVIPLPPNYIWWQVSAPMKTLEYLSRGKPIIATDIPFHRRIFDKGKCGLLLSSCDKKTLAAAITKIYEEKDLLVELGNVGKEIVKKYYTWEQSALDLEVFINKIIMMK